MQSEVLALLHARKAASHLADFPGEVPQSLELAYAVQRELIAAMGRPVLGWKVGRIPPDDIERLGETRLAGPIFLIERVETGEASIFVGGAAAVEAEFMLRLARVHDVVPDDDNTLRTLVDRVCAGIEVASSPVATIHDHAPFGIIADVGINNGNLLSPDYPVDGDFADTDVVTWINGDVADKGRASDVLDGPFGALRFVIELHLTGTIDLASGQWISAGTITGVHPVVPGDIVEVGFHGLPHLKKRVTQQAMIDGTVS